MTYKEIDKLTKKELDVLLTTTQEQLRRLRFAQGMQMLEKPRTIGHTRRTIARIQTALNQKNKAS